MDAQFWHQRWQSSRIGFHQQEINELLGRHWHRLGVPEHTEVLVPLCGKSRDMHWLAEQGHNIAGFELSPLAIRDFFGEAGVLAQQQKLVHYLCWQAGGFSLYEGDFFQAESLGRRFDAAYDRAALVALPEPLRPLYARLLARLLNPGAAMLLVTLDYAPAQHESPPFAVNEQEVRRLFGADFEVTLLDRIEEGNSNPRVASGERRFFDELCFLLRRK
ncbi:thiopurine S-methyltransferase [Zobellella denitrificans]